MIKLDREKLLEVKEVLLNSNDDRVKRTVEYIESITPTLPRFKVGEIVYWKEKNKYSIIYDAIIVKLPDEYSREYHIALLHYSVIRFVPENQLFSTFKEAKEANI